MPFNGSGTFNLIYNFVQDAANGIKILASRQDTQWSDLATNGFGNTITRDGQGSASANQPMNGFIHTNVGTVALANQYTPVGQLQSGQFTFTVAGGTSDIITSTSTPAITSLTNGMLVTFNATAANTTATPTYKQDGNTAIVITKLGGLPLVAGDILEANHRVQLSYSSVIPSWELLNPATPYTPTGSWTPTDASGASLTFTSVSGSYTMSGNLVVATGTLVYPATANGTIARIGGLPVTANSGPGAVCAILTTGATALAAFVLASTKTFNVLAAVGASNVTNANLSLVRLNFTISYLV